MPSSNCAWRLCFLLKKEGSIFKVGMVFSILDLEGNPSIRTRPKHADTDRQVTHSQQPELGSGWRSERGSRFWLLLSWSRLDTDHPVLFLPTTAVKKLVYRPAQQGESIAALVPAKIPSLPGTNDQSQQCPQLFFCREEATCCCLYV